MEYRSCADEAAAFGDDAGGGGHGHGHSHGGGGGGGGGHGHGGCGGGDHSACDHSREPDNPDGFSLFPYIDLDKVTCMNERTGGMARSVLRPFADAADRSKVLWSDDEDPSLLIFVPFTAAVHIRSIAVAGGADGSAPRRMKVFLNREDLDFALAEQLPAAQAWEMADTMEVAEYTTRVSKFQNANAITIYIPECFVGEETSLSFLGFKGESTGVKRQVVEAVYELRPQSMPDMVSAEMFKSHTMGM